MKYEMLKRQNYSLLLLLAACVLLNFPYNPYYNPLSYDTETYRYVALVIMKGGVPYRDVFDHKPPLIYFINCSGLFLGGWLQWIINTLLAMLATFQFFRLGEKHRVPYPWLLPLLFNLMFRDFLICMTGGHTREYTTVLTLIFFCVLMGERRWRYYVLGVLSGLIFFIQQEQVLALLPFFIYAFMRREDNSPFVRRFLGVAAGALTVALPIVLYFAGHHALDTFWMDAFGFNFGWYTTAYRSTFGNHLRRVKQVLDDGNYEVPALAAMTLGVASLVFRNNNKRLVVASLAAVLLSIIPEFMGGRGGTVEAFHHYYLALSASLSILLFSVFAFTEETVFMGRKAMAIYGILVCTSVGYTFLQHITHLSPRKDNAIVASPELVYLRQHPPGDYQLYVFGDYDYLCAYNEFGILAPTSWVYQRFWKHLEDKKYAILQSVMKDLLRYHTSYVVDCSTNWGGNLEDPTVSAIWRSFLREYYEQVPLTDPAGNTLWKWKGMQ